MAQQLRHEYLVSYDIQDTKIRTRVFKELEKHGLKNVQQSVFWGFLSGAELNAVKRFLSLSLQENDKSFIVHTNFNKNNFNYFIGHKRNDFSDWEEVDVI